MSRSKRSAPMPTAYTGTPAACSWRTLCDSEPWAPFSAPSVTTTSPASGTPPSSRRAPSSARPRSVRLPSNVSSVVSFSRRATSEKRKNRSLKRSVSADTIGASVDPNASVITALRARSPRSVTCIDRESSSKMPRKLAWGTTVATTSIGWSRQNTSTLTAPRRNSDKTTRSRRSRRLRVRTYSAPATAAVTMPAMTTASGGHGGSNTNVPRSKTTGRYLNRN